jgi:hypothetical protein
MSDDDTKSGQGELLADELVLPLLRPLALPNGKTLAELHLWEPTAGQLDTASKQPSDAGGLMSLIAQTSGVPESTVKLLASRDLTRAGQFFNQFSVPVPDMDADLADLTDEIVIDLIKAVKIGKGDTAQTYTSLTLTEPNGAQKEKAARASTQFGNAITLISLVSSTPKFVIERLKQRDFEACCHFLASYNATGQSVGKI